MNRISTWLFGGRLLYVMISALALVAVLTGVLSAVVISQVINNYLASAQADREARDLDLANGFYQLDMQDIVGISQRAAVDTILVDNVDSAMRGNSSAFGVVDQEIIKKLTVPAPEGSQAMLVLDRNGNILDARSMLVNGTMSPSYTQGNWGTLPLVADELSSPQQLSGTEVIPGGLLAEVGLAEQASVPIIQTAQEAPNVFNPEEGSAGLALTSVTPMNDSFGQPVGEVVALHLFNNDFSFVDNLKNVGEIDTATVFLGDLPRLHQRHGREWKTRHGAHAFRRPFSTTS